MVNQLESVWVSSPPQVSRGDALVARLRGENAEDLQFAIKDIQEHQYGLLGSGQELIAFVNPTESEVIQSFRAGVQSENGITPRYDFLQADNQPAFILQEAGQLLGKLPPGTIHGLPTVGKYGVLWIVETKYIPEHYFAVVATSGPNAPSNTIGVRQHANVQYQGLRMIPGRDQRYPLIEAYFTRSFGTGTRRRSAAVCFRVTSEDEYTAPTLMVSAQACVAHSRVTVAKPTKIPRFVPLLIPPWLCGSKPSKA